MIFELRTYTIRIGAMCEFLELYAREGLAVQTLHLGPPAGYCTTEVGELNQVVHFWGYADMADRQRRRAALESDPQWLAYRGKASSLGHVLRQENKILKAVDFAAFQPPMASAS